MSYYERVLAGASHEGDVRTLRAVQARPPPLTRTAHGSRRAHTFHAHVLHTAPESHVLPSHLLPSHLLRVVQATNIGGNQTALRLGFRRHEVGCMGEEACVDLDLETAVGECSSQCEIELEGE